MKNPFQYSMFYAHKHFFHCRIALSFLLLAMRPKVARMRSLGTIRKCKNLFYVFKSVSIIYISCLSFIQFLWFWLCFWFDPLLFARIARFKTRNWCYLRCRSRSHFRYQWTDRKLSSWLDRWECYRPIGFWWTWAKFPPQYRDGWFWFFKCSFS